MRLTTDEHKFLLNRKQEIEREIRSIEHGCQDDGPCYHELNERRVDLIDELNRVEAELERSQME